MNKQPFVESRIGAAVIAILCCVMWGSAFPALKISYTLMDVSSPFEKLQLAGIRFALAGILVLAYGRITGLPIRPPRGTWPIVLGMAAMQTFAAYTLYYVGMGATPASKASILVSSGIFLVVVLSHFFFPDDKLNVRKGAGLILGLSGIAAVNMLGLSGVDWSFSLTGEGFVLMSCLFTSFTVILVRKTAPRISAITLNGMQMLLGGLALFAVGWAGHPRMLQFTGPSLGVLLYMAALSAVAFTLWFVLLKHHRTGEIILFKFTEPVFGSALSVLLIAGETFTVHMLAGLILVAAGIAVVNWQPTGRPGRGMVRDTGEDA